MCRQVQEECDELLYTLVWSLVTVRNRLPAQVVEKNTGQATIPCSRNEHQASFVARFPFPTKLRTVRIIVNFFIPVMLVAVVFRNSFAVLPSVNPLAGNFVAVTWIAFRLKISNLSRTFERVARRNDKARSA